MKRLLLVAACLVIGTRADAMERAYVQMGPEGTPIIRVVTDAASCPTVLLNGVEAGMEIHARRAPPAFPVLTCEAFIPAGTTSAQVGAAILPLPVAQPNRIIIVGDTGCRLKDASIQACNVPAEWPFFEIAETAARLKPDLVIHVGDYHYRETPCPAGDGRCQPTPYGDNWAAWDADFFRPAAPLLEAAPWIMVRGNHEECSRAGTGWFHLLEPRRTPSPAAAGSSVIDCVDMTAPYWVPIGTETLWVLDSAVADDFQTKPDKVAAYRQQWLTMTQSMTGPAWLLVHKPVWGIARAGMLEGRPVITEVNPTLQQAADDSISANLFTVISGHIHTFQAVTYAGPRPAQVIVGNSGDALDKAIPETLSGIAVDGMASSDISASDGFGFLLLERVTDGWQGTLYDRMGVKRRLCRMHARSFHCDPA
jgi:hypothetical protein